LKDGAGAFEEGRWDFSSGLFDIFKYYENLLEFWGCWWRVVDKQSREVVGIYSHLSIEFRKSFSNNISRIFLLLVKLIDGSEWPCQFLTCVIQWLVGPQKSKYLRFDK
jgi:hypothetical protein